MSARTEKDSNTMSSTSLQVLAAAFVATCAMGWEKPQCPTGREFGAGIVWLADPHDCSAFYVCNVQQRFDFSCGENVWDQETKTCVGRGSQWDKCTIARELDSLAAEHELTGLSGSRHPCANSNTGIHAKGDNCAQYYDCSAREATISSDQYVRECVFPLLFNAETKRCEHYDTVKCGARTEPLDACDYEANQCRSAHCIPCNVRFPSCRGLPDGLNPWVGREYSPYYVLCEKQRSLYNGSCDNSRSTQIFDPEKRVCVEFKGNSQ